MAFTNKGNRLFISGKMKKWAVIFFLAGFWGCVQDNDFEDLAPIEKKTEFNLQIPDDFSWSAVMQDVLLVNVTSAGKETLVLDRTAMELYNENGELLDAVIINDGTACFNVRIPASTKKLILKATASNTVLEFSALKRSLRLEVPVSFKSVNEKKDTDGDGLINQFDHAPGNPQIALSLNENFINKTSSYFIFEDLWPSKGDFDFNDFIVKTSFSWKRGIGNYLTEISGIVEAQWSDSNYGLGFELFEAKGAYLIYMDDVIMSMEGAQKAEVMNNGLIVVNETDGYGKITRKFTVKIKDKSLTNFVFVPFLFRKENRQHQIRPFGTPPTQLQQMDMFRSEDDASPLSWQWVTGEKFKNPLSGDDAFYRTAEGHPWGVQFVAEYFVPSPEKQSIAESYPQFKTWAESGGKENKDWYYYPATE